VKRQLLDLAATAVLLTVALAVVLVLRPFGRELALHLYLLCVTALLLAAAVGALPARRRSSFDAALWRPVRPDARPPELDRAERTVALGIGSAFDLHGRLRPLLREAAAARLANARGIDLDSPAGRAAVGEEAWELLRPDRPPPDDRFAPGVDEAELRRLLAILETL
jgi:hypothetical protein